MLNRINTTELPPQRWSCPDHSRRKKHVAAIQIKRLSLSEGIEPFNGHAFDAKSPASNGLEACPATVAFYEDPDQQVEPSAQVVVAVDAWARELARNSLTSPTPTLFCTPDGQCTPAVELRLSRDLVSDPSGHPSVGRPESAALWLRENPDMDAIDGRLAHRLFLAICRFPAMRASWLREVLGGSAGEITRTTKDRFAYDESSDSFMCPQGKALPFECIHISSKGAHFRFYRAPGAVCRACPAFGVCTKSKNGRNVSVGPYDAALRRHRAWMATSAAKEVYQLRKQLVEPVFGIIKGQRAGRRFLLRGLANVAAEWTVLATAFNLRTLWRV